ncbi:MAG TPA: hypothetical protein VGD39_02500, partial [Nocardioides sp.]
MSHRKLPRSAREPRGPRVGALAPVLAVAFVVLVAWFSSWAFSAPDGSAPDSADTPPGDVPSQASDGSDPSGPDDTGDGSTGKDTGDGASGSADDGDDAALEESVRRFRKAQRELAQRVSQQLERRVAPLVFRVASFNVLGDSHTGPGGRPGYPDA